jgi:DNA-directed RNA polymerase specialized sigma24 family protein
LIAAHLSIRSFESNTQILMWLVHIMQNGFIDDHRCRKRRLAEQLTGSVAPQKANLEVGSDVGGTSEGCRR